MSDAFEFLRPGSVCAEGLRGGRAGDISAVEVRLGNGGGRFRVGSDGDGVSPF